MWAGTSEWIIMEGFSGEVTAKLSRLASVSEIWWQSFQNREQHVERKVFPNGSVCWRKRINAESLQRQEWWQGNWTWGQRGEAGSWGVRLDRRTAFPREEGMMLSGQGSFYLGRASVSQAWGQGPPAVRLAEPIIDWGLFYRNPKSQWKSRVENPCFSLRHSQYFPSEKTHYVQQRKRQPFPVEWIMRNCNREREGERAHKWQTTQD